MPEAADEQYFRRVEEHFGQRRGGPLVLSPKDWRLLEKWHGQGIPLTAVLRGINQAFDRFQTSGPRPDRINSLGYCEQEVHAAWEEHRAAHGRRDSRPRERSTALAAARRHLLAVAAACRTAGETRNEGAASCLAQAATSLESLEQEAAAGALGARDLDRRASELEAGLMAELADPEAGDSSAEKALGLPRFSPYEA